MKLNTIKDKEREQQEKKRKRARRISDIFDMAKVVVGVLLVFGCIVLIVWGCEQLESEGNEILYNNGVCDQCGGVYELFQVNSKDNHRYDYVYKCEDCDRVIITTEQM